MSRWLPDTKQRLRSAALDLIAEQGFAATTVPQITARAGLTTSGTTPTSAKFCSPPTGSLSARPR